MKYAVIEWRDGQPYSPEFDDIYFSSEGAREESSYVFLKQNGLPEKWWHHERFIIAETGFGTGLNFVLTLKLWMETADSNACLHYHAIEKYPVAPDDIRKLSGHWPELEPYFDALLSVYPLPVEGSHSRRLFDGRVYLHLDFMDVEKALSERRLFVDAWYLDGFSPARNPGIWNDDIYRLIALNSEKGASLCTFSCAGSVRRGLAAAGFAVSKSAGFGKKREMITALLPARQTVKSKTPWYELPIPVVKNKTAIVIGAGVAGLTTAYSLVQRGWQVTVLDKHSRVAQEASGNPAGIVLPRVSADNDPDASFYSSAFLYAVQQLDALQQSTEAVFWYRQGVFSIHEKNRADKIIKRYGYPEQYMHIAAFDILPDHLAARAGKVAYFPLAGWVRPEALCKVLVNACGDSLVFKALEAVSLEQNDNGWNVRTDNGNAVVSADIVIIANGVGVCAFEQTSWLPVSSIRGQLSLVKENEQSARLVQAISSDIYVTPAFNGEHCVGATYSYLNKETGLMQQDQDKNIDRINELLPGLLARPDKLSGRVGFRAVSGDRVPVVGAVPDITAFQQQYADLHHGRTNVEYENGKYLDGLYISAAHGSRGLCSSFLCAEIVASMIDGSPVPVGRDVLDHINPARFIIRYLRRGPKIKVPG